MKKVPLLMVLWCCLQPFGIRAQSVGPLLDSARNSLSVMQYSKALKFLKQAQAIDSVDPAPIGLKAETYLILGNKEFLPLLERLRESGQEKAADILAVKHALFIGSGDFPILLASMDKKYPGDTELAWCDWLWRLGEGDFEGCQRSAARISRGILFKSAPYLALYHHAWDRDPRLALQYLDTLESMAGRFYASKNRPVLGLLAGHPAIPPREDLIGMPFAWCGPELGFILTGPDGDSIRIALDTGTGSNMMTIHDLNKGKRLAGEDILTVPKGIQYNYMPEARDFFYKKTDLRLPAYRDFLIGYFDGKFPSADGCTSPFVFNGYALHMDPVHEKVYLRSHRNLDRYLRKNRGRIERIPYQVRNGWIYVPCRVNGREVMMMVESGSRDVNFNELAIKSLGLSPYESTIPWNGKEFKVKKLDCTIELGRIRYEVKGGLVSDFVLGNHYYGTGSAGDLGPEFLKNYSFIIDPFHHELIVERPTA